MSDKGYSKTHLPSLDRNLLSIRPIQEHEQSEAKKLIEDSLWNLTIPYFVKKTLKTQIAIFFPVFSITCHWYTQSLCSSIIIPCVLLTLVYTCYFWEVFSVFFVKENITECYIRPKQNCFFVAVYQGRVVGTTAVQEEDDRTARLLRMSVSPSCRGLGIGKALVNHAKTFCKEHGYEKLVLKTSESQMAAIKLYEACGFKESGQMLINHFLMTMMKYHFEFNLFDVRSS